MSSYTLYKDSRKLKLKEEQLNLKHIGQIFGVFPDSVFLIADDGSVETPDERGEFAFQTYLRYQVHGDPLVPKTPSTAKSSLAGAAAVSSSVSTSAPHTPRGISIRTKYPAKPPGVAAKGIEWTKGIEVN